MIRKCSELQLRCHIPPFDIKC